MEYCKLQIGCLLIVLYVTFIYIRERKLYDCKKKDWLFECLLTAGIFSIAFDGITAYTVNHQEQVPGIVNSLLHMCFLCSLDVIVFLMFLYMLNMSRGLPESGAKRFLLLFPLLVNIGVVILFVPQLTYRKGRYTSYSMGISAYACFVMVAVYLIAAVGVMVHGWRNLERHKRITVSTYLMASVGVSAYQMFQPEALITSLVPAFAVVGTYLNIENPLFTKLRRHNNEMVMGFATLVEKRDDNTGGHIRRTTEYVRMLAEELRRRGNYKEELTRDYIENLVMAAPMHDIGKIAIPDAILQKPGRLTAGEFEIMKTHAVEGGKIIQETFGHTGGDAYERIAYEVAAHHHEKWNGGGYPDGLAGQEIPLCARIMAIADVFDAVSARRCYREALPLQECFQIIQEGRGRDFDPVIADAFLDMKEEIRKVYESMDVTK